jgi:hypothetical protein
MQYSSQPPARLKEYGSFLLRCWQDHDSRRWKFSMESVTSRERMSFGDILELVEYLESQFQIEEISDQDHSNNQDRRKS